MKRRVSAVIAILVLVGLVGLALARPGGGDSYSGGGGHSSGGGGGGGGGSGGGGDIGAIFELIYWLIRLCIYAPEIGLPIVAAILLYILWSAFKQHKNKDWDSGPPVTQRTASLGPMRNLDPDFSQPVFEDFAFRLFSTAHRARNTPDGLAMVGPYVSASARETLAAMKPTGIPIQQVIVGSMRVVRALLPPTVREGGLIGRVTIALEFEANIATADKTYYTVETWTFGRDATARTKPPGTSRTFPCPNCGAPWQSSGTGTQRCASCQQVVDNGRFDWIVEAVSLASIDERKPTLTTNVPERGTDLPTYRHRDVDKRYQALVTSDPNAEQTALEARIRLIHREIAEAWSKNDLEPVRGLVSDGLYDYLDYWVQAYKQQGLRNLMTDLRITRFELAKVTRDRWYDAVTMRIWATGKDYVEDRTGEVVKGSKRFERPYSEYWTLIRSTDRKGPSKGDRSCGNCGAPLQVSMAGACTHCGAHVTAGEFDWVLSKIEQDDSYRG